jgi:hypothetical protein
MAKPALAISAALDNPRATPRLANDASSEPSFVRGTSERPPFPPGCPVKPLGIRSDMDGKISCYYLDHLGQLVGLDANNRHGKNGMIAIFGAQSWWLEQKFPQWSAPKYEGRGSARTLVQPSQIVGFDQAEASRALIEECGRQGIFDPVGKLRGRGAHPLEGGRFALHFGDRVMAPRWRAHGSPGEWEWFGPGLIEGHVYPAGEPIPRPAPSSVPPRAAIALTRLIQTWNWKRGLLDVRLVLGWLAAAPFGGALEWRPNVWITGPAGSGKSTLNGRDKVFHQILGRGVFRTGNASAAAIRQGLRNSTVPVMFDEIEASADNRRVQEVIEIARLASSGDTAHRGGQDHNAHEFTIQSCFQFSSINIPPLEVQDRSRLAILELGPLPDQAAPPELGAFNFGEMGREMQRRMIDGWPRLAETKIKFHKALASAGHSARACDQFGTLLACADLAMNDELPDDEEVQEWVDKCRPDRLAEVSETIPDELACLYHLLTSMVQARGSDERESLSAWIGRAVHNAMPIDKDYGQDARSGERLQQSGLKVVNAVYKPAEYDEAGAVRKSQRWGAREFDGVSPGYLAIAGDHQALNAAFTGSKWHKIHKSVFTRLAGSLEAQVKFGRLSLRAVLVPLAHVLERSELNEASQPGAAAAWFEQAKKEAEESPRPQAS